MISTPSACIVADKEKVAKAVLMPGDPLRAKYIAEKYLENPELFNTVRNMYGYTGTYKGKRISVMGSGMGIPSMTLYAHELYNFFDVDSIIRAHLQTLNLMYSMVSREHLLRLLILIC